MMDYNPNEEDQAVSLPQKLSVTTMVVWRDAAHDAAMSEWLQNAYIQAQRAGRGQYVADFDVSQRITKVKYL